MKKQIIQTALAAVVSVGMTMAVAQAQAASKPMEKCYGIAPAGKNACGTATHSCAGQAKVAKAPDEWILVPKGTCKSKGGALSPEAATKMKKKANHR